MPFVAQVKELSYRARVRRSGVTIADGRGKKFDEAAASTLATGRIMAGNASRPARMSVGGDTISSVSEPTLAHKARGKMPYPLLVSYC